MTTAYFDCSSGIAGNMVIGALLDLGVPENFLRQELKKLPLPPYQLIIKKVERNGIVATFFDVRVKHVHDHYHGNLKNILKIIDNSKLDKDIKAKAKQIYKTLINAEIKIHGGTTETIHLHEIGAADAIIDIIGSLICLKKLGINEIYSSPINVGSGIIKHSHGVLPVPAPATTELLKGIPFYGSPIKKELATPTGVVLITSLAKSFGEIPRMEFIKAGYGAGGFIIPKLPNALRIILASNVTHTNTDTILQIETNIDDLDTKLYDQAIAKLMKAGALDASIYPIRMKKKRNAFKLEILCEPKDKNHLLEALFTQTTTIGTRVYLVPREKLKRQILDGNKVSYLGEKIIRSKKE